MISYQVAERWFHPSQGKPLILAIPSQSGWLILFAGWYQNPLLKIKPERHRAIHCPMPPSRTSLTGEQCKRDTAKQVFQCPVCLLGLATMLASLSKQALAYAMLDHHSPLPRVPHIIISVFLRIV
jgi:hypothetical protein